MQNLIILYNPYYQDDVIEQHLKVLIENEKVAFGKSNDDLYDLSPSYYKEINNLKKKINDLI